VLEVVEMPLTSIARIADGTIRDGKTIIKSAYLRPSRP
jgi:hypothetical protein